MAFCGSAGRWRLFIWSSALGLLVCAAAAHGHGVLSRRQRSAAAHPAARAGRHAASRRPSASCCTRSTSFSARPARTTSRITSDFVGLIPSSYPVDLIHLFTSGPQDAIIQVALKPDAPRGEALRERLRAEPAARVARLPGLLRGRRHRHPGDELRIAHARRSGRAGRQPAGRLRLRAEGAGAIGQAGLPARSAIRAGEELSHARYRASTAIAPASSD